MFVYTQHFDGLFEIVHLIGKCEFRQATLSCDRACYDQSDSHLACYGQFSRWQIDDILFFPENRIWHFVQIVS